MRSLLSFTVLVLGVAGMPAGALAQHSVDGAQVGARAPIGSAERHSRESQQTVSPQLHRTIKSAEQAVSQALQQVRAALADASNNGANDGGMGNSAGAGAANLWFVRAQMIAPPPARSMKLRTSLI